MKIKLLSALLLTYSFICAELKYDPIKNVYHHHPYRKDVNKKEYDKLVKE